MTLKCQHPLGPTQQLVVDILADGKWRSTREVCAQIPQYDQQQYGRQQTRRVLKRLETLGHVEHKLEECACGSCRRGQLSRWRLNGHD